MAKGQHFQLRRVRYGQRMPNRSQPPLLTLFVIIFAVLGFALSYTFSQVFGNAVADWTVTWMGQMTGLSNEEISRIIGWYVVPAFTSGMLLWAAFLAARWYLKLTEFAADPNAPALTLPPMMVTEIAKHIRDNSVWGWRMYSRLNFKKFVQDHVPAEMRRAGAARDIRFIGTPPNSGAAVEIDRTYWRYAHIDGDRIWDARNLFFSEPAMSASVWPPLPAYQFGMAPRVDVISTWPRASLLRRAWAITWVATKKFYYCLAAKFRRS